MIWSHPTARFQKSIFGGASKGDPGRAGGGGEIQDSLGKILILYYTLLGVVTNNVVKFYA